MEYVKLANGVEIPKIGYGVFQISKDDAPRCVREAIETGYRHIDTAQSYFNEAEVGQGIKDSGIDRKDLFLTTKIWISNYGYENTLRSVDVSLKKLGTDYLDLVLLAPAVFRYLRRVACTRKALQGRRDPRHRRE